MLHSGSLGIWAAPTRSLASAPAEIVTGGRLSEELASGSDCDLALLAAAQVHNGGVSAHLVIERVGVMHNQDVIDGELAYDLGPQIASVAIAHPPVRADIEQPATRTQNIHPLLEEPNEDVRAARHGRAHVTVEGEECGVEVFHANVRRIPNHEIGLRNIGKEEVPDLKPRFGQFLGDRAPGGVEDASRDGAAVLNVLRTKVVAAEGVAQFVPGRAGCCKAFDDGSDEGPAPDAGLDHAQARHVAPVLGHVEHQLDDPAAGEHFARGRYCHHNLRLRR